MKAKAFRKVAGKNRRGAEAFTLIEIMVVVALIGIVMTMGIPAIRGAMKRDPLTQAVVDVTDACKAARAQAILTGNPTVLRFYPGEKRVEVAEPAQPAPPDGKPAPPKSGYMTPKGFSAAISDRVNIRLLYVNFVDYLRADAAVVKFQPNGTCDEFTVVLQEDAGEGRQISLDIVTSLPNVTAIR